MTLQEIIDNLNIHKGSWGLPDFSISEKISDALGIPRDMTTGGSQNYGDYAEMPSTKQNLQEAAVLAEKRKAAATSDKTGGGNGGGGGDTTTNPTPDPNSEFNRKKAAILSRLEMMKGEAGRQRGMAKEGYDFTTGEVHKNYDSLLNKNTQKMIEALQNIGTTEGETQTIYSKAGGNARRAMESALTRNRMLYRALGALGSSFFANAQSDTTNQAMNSVNDSELEEADKLSQLTNAKGTTRSDYGGNEVTIDTERTGLLNDALTDYKNALANADLLEKNYTIDSEEDIGSAEDTLNSALEAIKKYTGGGYKTVANNAATQATSGNAANYANNYNYKAGIQDALNKTSGLNKANDFSSKANSIGTGTTQVDTPTSVFSNLIANLKNRNKKVQEDPTGYFVNYA